jgi:hypothetical protein
MYGSCRFFLFLMKLSMMTSHRAPKSAYLDIPLELADVANYRASLGHKVKTSSDKVIKKCCYMAKNCCFLVLFSFKYLFFNCLYIFNGCHISMAGTFNVHIQYFNYLFCGIHEGGGILHCLYARPRSLCSACGPLPF